MSQDRRDVVRGLPLYKQGASHGENAVKLSSNENPFEPLPSVIEAVTRTLPRFNRYPSMSAEEVRSSIAGHFGVDVSQVAVGAGSTEVASQLMHAFAGAGDEIIFPWRSFEAYPILTQVAGATPVPAPLTKDLRHDLDAMSAAITDRTRLIFLCTPNNPTGTVLHTDEVVEFLARVPQNVVVVMDEAYYHFNRDDAAVDGLTLLNDHPNVVVLRTFSKAYGLAGLRVGYAVGDPRVLAAARSTGIPLSVTAAAEEAALASLDAEDELRARVAELAERRDALAARLRDVGWDVPVAQGNFVWLPAGDRALEVAAAFDAAGLIVRPFAGDGVRISIGEAESLEPIVIVAAAVAP